MHTTDGRVWNLEGEWMDEKRQAYSFPYLKKYENVYDLLKKTKKEIEKIEDALKEERKNNEKLKNNHKVFHWNLEVSYAKG